MLLDVFPNRVISFSNFEDQLVMEKIIKVPSLMFSKNESSGSLQSDTKTIKFLTNCLTVLLLLNISTVESLRNEIRWFLIK